jgi:transaldolase
VPYAVLMQMVQHPLTDIGIKRFLADYKSVAKNNVKERTLRRH